MGGGGTWSYNNAVDIHGTEPRINTAQRCIPFESLSGGRSGRRNIGKPGRYLCINADGGGAV